MATNSLGTLTLDLMVKMGAFQQGMDRAQRLTEKNIQKMEQSWQRLEARTRLVVQSIVGGLAAIGAKRAFEAFIQNTVKAEQQQAQLTAVLQSTGASAWVSQKYLNDMASSLSVLGGKSLFTAGQINEAQTRMLSFTNVTGEMFPEAMQAAIDMATRMGMDINQAAELIGRSLDIPSQGLTALSRQGFKFTEEQKALVIQLERTGKGAEAQALILNSVKEAYGGAAEAARNTFGGALEALRESLNEATTGDVGSMSGFKDSVEALTATLSSEETKQSFGVIFKLLADLVTQITNAINAFVHLGQGLGIMFAQAIHGSDDPVGRMTDRIAAIQGRIDYLNGQINGTNVNTEDPLAVQTAGIEAFQNQLIEAEKELQTWTGYLEDYKRTSGIVANMGAPVDVSASGLGTGKPLTITHTDKGAEARAEREALRALQEQQRMAREYNGQLHELNLSYMELQGHAVEVAGIRFDDQVDGLKAWLTLEQRFEDIAFVDTIKQAQLAAVEFQEALKPAQGVLDNLQYAEQMLSVTQQLQGVGEIAALRQLGALRVDALRNLNAELDRIRALIASGNGTPEMVRQLQDLELQAAQLEAGLDPLSSKFSSLFSDGLESPLHDFIMGTKNAADAFRDMASSIISDLARIALQESLSGLFKSSGMGGWFGSLFGSVTANAKGGVYSSASGLHDYVNTVVSKPTIFPFAKGGAFGLMGEAGNEGILPLARTRSGDLGVKLAGEQLSQNAVNNQINITVNVENNGQATTTSSGDSSNSFANNLAIGIKSVVQEEIAKSFQQGGFGWKAAQGR